MLKKRLRCFLASLVNFYIATAFETLANYFINFWMTASGSFIIETAFCERDKNHKFDNFKTIYPAKPAGISFLMGSRFILSGYQAIRNAD